MPITIHNKEYFTVAERIAKFRDEYPKGSIKTKLVSSDGPNVIMKATITIEGEIIATGFAEEVRGSTNINKTSALENCETSACGRALAFFGLAGTEIASADEVKNAISQQDVIRQIDISHAIADNSFVIWTVKHGIECEQLADAADSWFNLSDDIKKSLWIARSKGGAFTTKEREVIKSSEFRQAHFGDDKTDS